MLTHIVRELKENRCRLERIATAAWVGGPKRGGSITRSSGCFFFLFFFVFLL